MGERASLIRFRPSTWIRVISLMTFVSLLALSPVLASDDDDTNKLQIHGFLTQAIASANYGDLGPTPEDITIGIPEDDPTTDYRFLALQFRYQSSPKDIFVVQLSSRSLGDSPINDVEDDIELDWAFYERLLGDQTSVKVGRIQIPLGIYNEIRDVGTILPFYRPAYVFYREGSFTSETVDGILLHHTFAAETDWALSLDAFYGEYELVEQGMDPFATPSIATAEDVKGVQFWLNTPLFGLRFGLGGQQRDVTEGQEGIFRPIGGATPFDDWYTSVEYLAGDWQFRGEYREISAPFGDPAAGFTADEAKNTTSYLQLGYFFTEKFGIFVQQERSEVDLSGPLFTQSAQTDQREDFGISLNFRFTPSLVLKAEYHEVDQEIQGFSPVFLPTGFFLDPFVIQNDGGSYSILSFATSF